jgi:hypothetical protein
MDGGISCASVGEGWMRNILCEMKDGCRIYCVK